MSDRYNYLVPTYAGSAWDSGVAPVPETPWKYQPPDTIRQTNDPDRPRVGLYCAHDNSPEQCNRPWLLGSFTVSSFLWWDLEPAAWAWQRTWTWHLEWQTGDGVVFPLLGVPQQNLIDNKTVVPEGGALRRTTADDGRIVLQHERQEPRGQLQMKCRVCGHKGQPHRLEKIQHLVTGLWSNGFRELKVHTFDQNA